ncbi:uncharacterized protein LOC110033974 [Phalaenopsis equestris]|uniref:uncharacterized protein LOC110033974 n=1 Tax=Phalaenopsis equestris TaxID=78828 RepID=UPI0009E39661|nr:uncharacterized protein LOC110033974 [Phalaenopsis equestris]
MEAITNGLPLLALLLLFCTTGVKRANGAGECGNVSADTVAFQMAPCALASQDANTVVSAQCCSAVQKIGQNPKCLCAVMLLNTAKSVGVSPVVAVTIPTRCGIANRPVGYRCGGEFGFLLFRFHEHSHTMLMLTIVLLYLHLCLQAILCLESGFYLVYHVMNVML